jgi:hypothetical protein
MTYNCVRAGMLALALWSCVACAEQGESSTALQAVPMEVAGSGPIPGECVGAGYDARCYEAGKLCPAADLSFGLVCAQTDQGLSWRAATGEGQVPCPAFAPIQGSPCPSGQSCPYGASTLACDAPEVPAARADCNPVDSTWDVWSPLSCEALSADAACDPQGTWLVTLTPDSLRATGRPCGGVLPETIELTIRAAEGGALELSGFSGDIAANGCQLWISRLTPWRNASENGSVQLEVELSIDGDAARGTFGWTTSGFCNGGRGGLASAVRL